MILLSRVVTRLGALPAINPKVIESLYATDLALLQDLYNRVNQFEGADAVVCPECRHEFLPELAAAGGSWATPSTGSLRR